MISCTEFIPAYSTLFNYLEENWGPEEVPAYWNMHFDPKKAPIYKYVSVDGLRGCYAYWSIALNEEAADFTMYLNEKRGFYLLDMHHCPSKGRLLELQKEIGLTPYPHYCLHCDYYRASIEASGLCYLYNFQHVDKAACSILVYDPKLFDGRVIIDEDTMVMDRRAADNEYFHRAFHNSLNRGLDYLYSNYGEAHLRKYLQVFATTVYSKIAEDARIRGLAAIQEKILDTYEKEHAREDVDATLEDGILTVHVRRCPAIAFFKAQGTVVTPLYHLTTETVMQTLAANSGYEFSMDHYDPNTGEASYRFLPKQEV